MAIANLTGGEKQKTVEQLLCSAGLYAGIQGQLTFFSALNIFLCITAFLGNALILAALRKESSLHPPSKLLIRSLATTDLFVGLVSQPLLATLLISVLNEQWNICRYVVQVRFITDPTLSGVSLLTLAAISVDRLLALLLGLRYKQVVTLKRTYVTVIAFWIVFTVFSTMRFWNASISSWCTIIVIFLCLVTSSFSYTKIFLTLRHRQNQVQDQAQQQSQTDQLNIARYRRAVSSALWLQLTLLACYLPFYIGIAFTVGIGGLSTLAFLVWCYTGTLVFLNSSLNPILYCWKIGEVRQAVYHTVRQVLCSSSS